MTTIPRMAYSHDEAADLLGLDLEDFRRDVLPSMRKLDKRVLAREVHALAEERRRLEAATGFVYFIRAGRSAIKIGFATDPIVRLADLQVGNHEELELLGVSPGTMADERALHRQFASTRIRGEWFRITQPLLDRAAHEKLRGTAVGRQVAGTLTTAGHLFDRTPIG